MIAVDCLIDYDFYREPAELAFHMSYLSESVALNLLWMNTFRTIVERSWWRIGLVKISIILDA